MKRFLTVERKQKVLLALTCHEAYFHLLPSCMKSIDDNCAFDKILLLDNCEYQTEWQTVTVTGRPGPNKLRNHAIQHALENGYEWIVYFDADNKMPRNFGAMIEVGIENSYSNVGIIFNSCGHKISELSESNYIDTASAWRAIALKQAGGWDESLGSFDDWSMALRIKNLGYKFAPLGLQVVRNKHEENRGSKKSHQENCWKVRSVGVFTLFSGNKHLNDFVDYLSFESWPSNVHFYWVDNANCPAFSKRLLKAAARLIEWGHSITIKIDHTKVSFNDHKDESRHQHVCGLYNRHIGNVTENLILFHEDDVIPQIGSYQKISSLLYPQTKVAGVGAAYRTRTSPSKCCASRDPRYWRDNPAFDEIDKPVHVGMMGGGYSLYLNYAVKQILPFKCNRNDYGGLQGWDGNMGHDLHKLGWKLILDGSTKCEHRTKEVQKFLTKQSKIKEQCQTAIPT